MSQNLPEFFQNEDELDEFMSRPQQRTVDLMRRLDGDLLILGVAGKMGVSLAELAVRSSKHAGVDRKVIGIARFSDPSSRDRLDKIGVETIKCDLLNPEAVAALPRIRNVIFMAGRKFGTGANSELTWAMNTVVPAIVSRIFRDSRIVAFSTGCVYPFVAADSGGSKESDPVAPVGEYAQSCLGRERVFQHYSASNGTPVSIVRLNYAIDLRYGVLHDIAQSIKQRGVVDVRMGHFNMIWQGDANAIALLLLEHCTSPARIANLTGPDTLFTRDVGRKLAEQMGMAVEFENQEEAFSYLNNARRTLDAFGGLTVDVESMIRWNADWVSRNQRSLSKPTHFEVSDGSY